MKILLVAYCFALGYLAKKYDVPERIAGGALRAIDAVAHTAGESFADGLAGTTAALIAEPE